MTLYSIITGTSWVPVEGKSPVCLICMKYRIIILIINIISLGQIIIVYCKHNHAHARTHRRRRRTGYRYSLAPNRDGPLCWRQCRSLAIEINTREGDPVSPRFWMFFSYKKILGRTETRTRDRMYCQSIRKLETSPGTIEQELRPAVCEHRQTDIRRIIV